MNIDLSSDIAVVTGGTGQLGRAIVSCLAECGASVAICYQNNRDFAEQLTKNTEEKYRVKAGAFQVDVSDMQAVEAMRQRVLDKLGAASILVNAAMVQTRWNTVLGQSLESYNEQFQSCVMQNVHMVKCFVPDMIKASSGRIIGINTECSIQNFETQSSYVVAKRGMDALYRVLAKEVGPYNITVNQIAPGWILSDNCRHHDGSECNENQDFPYVDRVPLRRRGTDTEIGYTVCWLASDYASFITGAFLPVCGGNVMTAI